MPTANAIPAREMTFNERPIAAIATNAPITETGIAREMIIVARKERRKDRRIRTASAPPTQIFCFTRSIAELIYIVSS